MSSPPDDVPAGDDRPLDPAAVARAVDRLSRAEAPPWLHAEVARRLAERLSIIKLQPTDIADWSGFLGAGQKALAEAYPRAARVIVEPTETLAERSRAEAKQPWWSAKRYVGAPVDVTTSDPVEPVQLIWSSMALHAVRNPPALFERWQRVLAAEGFVMFACLGPGSLIELRQLYRRLGWGPAMGEFVDMHDLGDMLVRAGFADPVMDQETLTLTWESPAALLAELRGLGANVAPDRFAGLRTPRWRARLEAELKSLAGPDGRIALSFELAYGHAFKGEPRRRPNEPTVVSLDEMRSLVRKGAGRP